MCIDNVLLFLHGFNNFFFFSQCFLCCLYRKFQAEERPLMKQEDKKRRRIKCTVLWCLCHFPVGAVLVIALTLSSGGFQSSLQWQGNFIFKHGHQRWKHHKSTRTTLGLILAAVLFENCCSSVVHKMRIWLGFSFFL